MWRSPRSISPPSSSRSASRSATVQDVKVDADAGVLAITGARRLDDRGLSSKKDIQGNRKSLGLSYGDSWQQTIPAGDYVVVRHMSDNGHDKEMPVTVKAGERTEITVQS